jgi:NAD(P)H dehydrogenase (quinone)
MVSASEDPDRLRLHTSVVEVASDAGIQRVVYTSFLGAAPDSTFTFGRDHWHTGELLRASGLRHTLLRDNLDIDFLPLPVGADKVIRGPAGGGRAAAVTCDHIAEVAVLTDDEGAHDGRTYDLTGPQALSLGEAAEELSRAARRPGAYDAETIQEAYASRAAYRAPDWEVAGWVTTYVAIANGDLEQVSGDVAVTGHPR